MRGPLLRWPVHTTYSTLRTESQIESLMTSTTKDALVQTWIKSEQSRLLKISVHYILAGSHHFSWRELRGAQSSEKSEMSECGKFDINQKSARKKKMHGATPLTPTPLNAHCTTVHRRLPCQALNRRLVCQALEQCIGPVWKNLFNRQRCSKEQKEGIT